MSDTKQQIVEKLKENNSILVTVGSNPTVDELSATLGLTLLLNKMDKHATAIFSGEVPTAIHFLDPEKTFESTVDSLRDFIIALDKEKADHLRYKVVDDMVKIFITPYRTTISEKDLEFSQGDYNVEMVIAIGVRDTKDLDKALEAHGKILEDATVVTLSCGDEAASLGGIDWHETRMSSYCEMAMNLVEAMKPEKNTLDEQIATAFLTGLVAATERFSNNKTSSRVMTIAAQLMSQGANQQLIATKLGETASPSPQPEPTPPPDESPKSKKEPKNSKKSEPPVEKTEKPTSSSDDAGSLSISHQPVGTLEEVEAAVTADRQEAAAEAAQDQLDAAKEAREREDQAQAAARAEAEIAKQADKTFDEPPKASEPDFGGTLNATTEQAEKDARSALESDKNHKILSHDETPSHGGYIVTNPDFQSPINSSMSTASSHDDQAASSDASEPNSAPTLRADDVSPPSNSETLADIDAKHRDARDDIEAALREADGQSLASHAGVAPTSDTPVTINPVDSGATPLPTPSATPALPPLPPLPPMPDFSTLPPLPPMTPPPASGPKIEPVTELSQSAAKDPGQFRIPGQS